MRRFHKTKGGLWTWRKVKACGEGACEVNDDCENGEWGDWEGPSIQTCADTAVVPVLQMSL